MTSLMKKYLPYFLLALPFFLLKATSIGIWLSDTNIYFYTGYKLLQGQVLYKDIFFTNFPLFPYASALYVLLTRGNLPLFFFTSAVEVLVVGFIIYKIILAQEKSRIIALCSSGIYLYSFIVLATSNHQTGVFLGSLFAILSYSFFIRKRLFVSGIFIACALLTKAYFLPIALSFFLFLLIKKRSVLMPFLLGSIVTFLIILSPSLLLAAQDLFRDVIAYSLTRSQGIPKMNIAQFFMTHDPLYILILLWNILMIRRHLLFGMLSLLSIVFFLFYQDIYYLYLNFCIPLLALSFPTLYNSIQKTFSLQKMVLPTIIGIILTINTVTYFHSFRTQQKIENIEAITSLIKKQNPPTLYGINSLAPALSYLTDTPLLNNIIDTNENIFRKGFLNKQNLTDRAIEQEALIISNAAIYPGTTINYPLLGGIFVEEKVIKSCQLIGTYFIKPEGVENAITIFDCKKLSRDK